MNQILHPASMIYAVHPAYFGQMDQMANNLAEQEQDFESYTRTYLGAASAANTLKAFNPNDVHQYSEREYYSYDDGIRYYLSNSGKRVALLPLAGLMYGYKYDYLISKIESAKHEAYHGILFMADTPGGMVRKMESLREAIADYPKPVGVYVSGMLASAGAYVTAPADFIHVNPKDDNLLGSIGIVQLDQNYAENLKMDKIETRIFRNEGADMKYRPNSYEPWSDEEIQAVQDSVNKAGNRFHEVMKETRFFSEANWNEIKRGSAYDHNTALAMGLIDGLSTREEALERVASINHQLYI